MAAGATYEPVYWNQISGTSTSAVTISGIASTWTDLKLIVSMPPVSSPSLTNLYFQVGNGTVDTGSSYYWVNMSAASGSWTNGTSNGAQTAVYTTRATGVSSSTSYMINGDFMNYKGSLYKTFILRAGGYQGSSTSALDYVAGTWASTSAITAIKMTLQAGTFGDGTTIALYGIAAA